MRTNGTNGDDAISATGNVDGLGGNDFILAHSTTSTEDNPQIINTGSGNNSVVAQADYTYITGGTGNDSYTMIGANSTIVDAGGNNNVVRTSSDGGTYNITFNGDGNNTVTDNTFNWAIYNINCSAVILIYDFGNHIKIDYWITQSTRNTLRIFFKHNFVPY